MLKAKALCAVNGNAAPEIRPLMSMVEVPATDTHGNGFYDLIGGMQNIVIESVGSDEEIPEAVGQLGIRMMKSNVLIKDLMHELRQHYIRGQKDFRLPLAGRSDAEKKQIISLFQDMAGFVGNIRYCAEFQSLNGSLDIKRILVGNMIVISSLMNGVACERFGIMETMRPAQELPITDGCILRTAANIQLDEESILLYEIVRSTPHAMRKLADKVSRYYTLINDSHYRENNYYGYEAVPQLIICGESYAHCVKIDQYLRSRGLISETDSLLYTEDLFYVQQTLQPLYELDEEGNRSWYSLPEDGYRYGKERIGRVRVSPKGE